MRHEVQSLAARWMYHSQEFCRRRIEGIGLGFVHFALLLVAFSCASDWCADMISMMVHWWTLFLLQSKLVGVCRLGSLKCGACLTMAGNWG